jgi:hypothetical protein
MIHVTVSGNVTIARGLLFVPHAPNANNWKDTSKYPKTARAKSPAIKPILPHIRPMPPQHVYIMPQPMPQYVYPLAQPIAQDVYTPPQHIPQDVQPISQDVQLMPQHVHLMSEEPSIVDWFDIYE